MSTFTRLASAERERLANLPDELWDLAQTMAAAGGITAYLERPNSWRLLATPANSAMMLPKLVTTSASIRAGSTTTAAAGTDTTLDPAQVATLQKGAQVFSQICSACHQPGGAGRPGTGQRGGQCHPGVPR
mgnify:CR=1 FL=1